MVALAIDQGLRKPPTSGCAWHGPMAALAADQWLRMPPTNGCARPMAALAVDQGLRMPLTNGCACRRPMAVLAVQQWLRLGPLPSSGFCIDLQFPLMDSKVEKVYLLTFDESANTHDHRELSLAAVINSGFATCAHTCSELCTLQPSLCAVSSAND
ncbi:hypothetical protein CYMTET_21350 [Cymbomonas tetramitiformis]|uniref:Uncharacterized protein n=1 Tax=Cymbomonas tetramitiformis TaxID=36881 RepID=A0AAE0L3D1_9CHLO|nr:hypothetical protein CYMTET_21350 [Cymbomonas tetramitiformis]